MTWPDELAGEPWRFHLFDVLRRFEREHPDKPRIGESAATRQEILRLGQDPYAEFPASNISRATIENGKLTVYSRFLGLLGPQGALPLQTTFEAMQFERFDRDDALPRFLDLLNQRFIQLFFRAWSDARPAGQHDRPDDDRFANYLGSAIGIGTEPFHGRDSAPDMEKLALAGLLGPAVKSTARIEGMLAYVFKVTPRIDPLVGTWLKLSKGDQTSLGGLNASLGRDSIAGSAVYSVQDKFRIRIEARSLAQFEEFLPSGRHFEHLVDLLYNYLGDLLEYEVQLLLPTVETKAAALGTFGRLGWTTWMTDEHARDPSVMRGDCVFHPAERAAEMRRNRNMSKGEH